MISWLWLWLGCAPAPEGGLAARAHDGPAPELLREARYTLAWDRSSVAEDDGAWSVARADGDTVRVTDGLLVTWYLYFEQCDGVAGLPLGGRAAWAHTGGATDPSRMTAPWAEALVPLPAPTEVAHTSFPPALYCALGTAVARGGASTRNLAPDAPRGVTLWLTGEVGSEAAGWSPFTLSTASSFDAEDLLVDLDADDPHGEAAHATLTRTWAGAFDGLDLASGEAEVARELLLRLVRGRTWAVTWADPAP